MTEISILRALESTNAVNRVIGEALGEALQGIEQIKESLGTLLDRTSAQGIQQKDMTRAIGTLSLLVEQHGDDLTQYAHTNNEQVAAIRRRLDELSPPPPDDNTLPPSEEPTDPAIPSICTPHLAIAR